MDGMEDVNAYMELIKENIEYEHHMKYAAWQDKALYEELFEVICEIVCVKRTTVKVAGEDYPYELVKSNVFEAGQRTSGICDGLYEKYHYENCKYQVVHGDSIV